VLARAAALGPRWLAGRRSAELTALATEGIDALDGYFSRYLPQLILAVIVPVAVLIWVGAADLLSGVIILVTLPLIPLFGALVGMATGAYARRRWEALARLSHHFLDVVTGLPTLKVFGRSREQRASIGKVTGEYRSATLQTLRIAFLSALVLELVATLSVALIAVSIGLRLVNGHLDLRTGLLVLILAPEAYLPLRAVGAQFHASAADGPDGPDGPDALAPDGTAPATGAVPADVAPVAGAAEPPPLRKASSDPGDASDADDRGRTGRRLTLAGLLGTLAAVCSIGLLATSAWLISRAAERPSVLYLMVAVTAVQAFAIGRSVFRYAERLASHDAALRILARLRMTAYGRLERLAPAGLAAFRSGDLLSRLVTDIDSLADRWLRVRLPYAVAAAAGAGAVAVSAALLPSAGLVLAASLVGAAVLARRSPSAWRGGPNARSHRTAANSRPRAWTCCAGPVTCPRSVRPGGPCAR
jgi:ABC-type transport system involved in cytochrome bd biosynthesis fused ATPase/permease subunit